MNIEIFSLGDIKEELSVLPRYFEKFDTMGGINNRHLPKLEKKLEQMTGRVASSVSSCTNGIYLALKQLNLNNDPVFIPPITFFGLGAAILQAGGIPVFTKVDKYGLLDVSSLIDHVEQVWPKKAKAVIPCHINNRYVNLQEIPQSLSIIEDAAPALGTTNKENKCIIADSKNTSVISFSYGKPLTAGEGGMIFSDDATAKKIKGQRYCGLDNLDGQYGYGKFEVSQSNLKLAYNGLSAMVVWEKLKKFDIQLQKRKSIAKYFFEKFGHLHEFDLYENGNQITHVLLLKDSNQREKIKKKLTEVGIKSYQSHPPMFNFSAFKTFPGVPGYQETANSYYEKVLHIPSRYDLTDLEVEFIAETLQRTLSSC